MTWTIRDAVPSDDDGLRDVYRRSSLSNAGDRDLLLANPDVLDLPPAGARAGRTRVAVSDGRVVGFATTDAAEGALELDALFVDPDWMRQGVGRDLVLDAAADASARGLTHIEVTGNEHALAFYEQLGFVVVGTEGTPLGVVAPRLRRPVAP